MQIHWSYQTRKFTQWLPRQWLALGRVINFHMYEKGFKQQQQHEPTKPPPKKKKKNPSGALASCSLNSRENVFKTPFCNWILGIPPINGLPFYQANHSSSVLLSKHLLKIESLFFFQWRDLGGYHRCCWVFELSPFPLFHPSERE